MLWLKFRLSQPSPGRLPAGSSPTCVSRAASAAARQLLERADLLYPCRAVSHNRTSKFPNFGVLELLGPDACQRFTLKAIIPRRNDLLLRVSKTFLGFSSVQVAEKVGHVGGRGMFWSFEVKK